MVVSGGAALSSGVKNRFLELLPERRHHGRPRRVGDRPAGHPDHAAPAPRPPPARSPRRRHVHRQRGPHPRARARPTSELGWLAQQGRVPLGYLGDEAKTARTFPVIDGVRYSVPGDRARYTPDGLLDLHGRDSVTINSGGEKIFAEEVEAALMRTTRPCTTSSSPAARASAGATRSSPSCSSATAATPSADDLLAECETPHRPLQAAEGHRVRRPDRAQPGRQGRLPLGPRAGHQGRRLIAILGRRPSRRIVVRTT